VDWYPFGKEAFEKAKKDNKMIFLSIGYSTCHWCHVMERESFENVEIAKILNEHFVSIKLDREERPDIDKIYMDSLHAMGQQGGWPLNVFLTPDGRPVTGGTYFPPVAKYGRKGFPEILLYVADLWKTKQNDLLLAASDVTKYIQDKGDKLDQSLSPDFSSSKDALTSHYKENYDPEFFGFLSNSTNKFPPSLALNFLLNEYRYTKEESLLAISVNTVLGMKRGGIYDQIGGGLSRYSTDREWTVPHFEKMLYDNSLYMMSIARLNLMKNHPYFEFILMDIFQYLKRDLSNQNYGYFSAEDADSEGEEGKFYVWDYENLLNEPSILNSLQESGILLEKEGNWEGNTILRYKNEAFYSKLFIKKEELVEMDSHLKSKLLSIRSGRKRPSLDDKTITSWNSYLGKALCESYFSTLNQVYLQEAKGIYNNLKTNLIDESKELIYRRFRDGDARFHGTLQDYASFVLFGIYLYHCNFEVDYLKDSIRYLKWIEKYFLNPNGLFYDSDSRIDDLIFRPIDIYDGVEPSGNSIVYEIYSLLKNLGYQTEHCNLQISQIEKFIYPRNHEYPWMSPYFFQTWSNNQSSEEEYVIIAKDKSTSLESLQNLKTWIVYGKPILYLSEREAKEFDTGWDILEGRRDIPHGTQVVYECKNKICQLPNFDLEKWQKIKTNQQV
jgi:hypothetical protein